MWFVRREIARVFLIILFCLSGLQASPRILLSKEEFRALAIELAPKVNIFSAIWKEDASARFYGGSSRDYLYWLLGKLSEARDEDELQSIVVKLRAAKLFDIRDVLGSESDIDVILSKHTNVRAEDYGIRKIDPISAERFDPHTKEGRTEIDQGFIPVEKIILAKDSIETAPTMGDGLQEIYDGILSIHFAEDSKFWKTQYAEEGINHPLFLAIRFLRLKALDWAKIHGRDRPNPHSLFNFDAETKRKIEKLFEAALQDPNFKKVLQNDRGLRLLNKNILKAFRSYTNPTAAFMLFEKFGFMPLQRRYPQIESINQFLFVEPRNPDQISKNWKAIGMDPENVFAPANKFFPDGLLYHGTRTEEAFRAILLQGVLPSENGSAGRGLYGVSSTHKEFAKNWGQSKDRVVVFPVLSSAKIVDITEGPGKKLWNKWRSKYESENLEKFCSDFGIDILSYPYTPQAFVVKNSAALDHAQGLERPIMSFDQALSLVKEIKNLKDFHSFLMILGINGFAKIEKDLLLAEIPDGIFSIQNEDQRTLLFLLGMLFGQSSLLHRPFNLSANPELYQFFKRVFKAVGELEGEETKNYPLRIWKTLFDLKESPVRYSVPFEYRIAYTRSLATSTRTVEELIELYTHIENDIEIYSQRKEILDLIDANKFEDLDAEKIWIALGLARPGGRGASISEHENGLGLEVSSTLFEITKRLAIAKDWRKTPENFKEYVADFVVTADINGHRDQSREMINIPIGDLPLSIMKEVLSEQRSGFGAGSAFAQNLLQSPQPPNRVEWYLYVMELTQQHIAKTGLPYYEHVAGWLHSFALRDGNTNDLVLRSFVQGLPPGGFKKLLKFLNESQYLDRSRDATFHFRQAAVLALGRALQALDEKELRKRDQDIHDLFEVLLEQKAEARPRIIESKVASLLGYANILYGLFAIPTVAWGAIPFNARMIGLGALVFLPVHGYIRYKLRQAKILPDEKIRGYKSLKQILKTARIQNQRDFRKCTNLIGALKSAHFEKSRE